MRIKVVGDCESADVLGGYIKRCKFILSDFSPEYTVYLETGDKLTIDGIDCQFERDVISCICQFTETPITLKRAGGNQSDRAIRVSIPNNQIDRYAVEHGVAMAIIKTYQRKSSKEISRKLESKSKVFFKKVLSKIFAALVTILTFSSLIAQVQVPSGSGVFQFDLRRVAGVTVSNGVYLDTTNFALRINCVVGCGAGPSGLTDAELRATPVPVSGTFYQATQPVSGTFWQATQPVSGTFFQGTQPVSGTFWQGTQPVSGAFFQATQPVSLASTVNTDPIDDPTRDLGKVDIASLDQYTPVSGRLPVDGSGVTQPVSGPLTDAQLRAVAVPISGTVTASGPLTDAQLRASAVPVSGTFFQGTQPVSIAAVVSVNTKTALTFNAPAAASVGVSSAQALASNASRKGAVFVNTSNATISCSVAQTAVLNSGVTLFPGGVWTMHEFTFATGAVNCIASAAASNLSIQELQ